MLAHITVVVICEMMDGKPVSGYHRGGDKRRRRTPIAPDGGYRSDSIRDKGEPVCGRGETAHTADPTLIRFTSLVPGAFKPSIPVKKYGMPAVFPSSRSFWLYLPCGKQNNLSCVPFFG